MKIEEFLQEYGITGLTKMIHGILKDAYYEGVIDKKDIDFEDIFPFPPSEITEVHFYHKGIGDGVFLVNKEGKKYNCYGELVK
ncbi:MAG: hypothetical protein AAGD25_10050 [Cyanobacteria bacterium P01_F01_bin.150]